MFFQEIKNKKYILVDYFDTVVFRTIHSCQVLPQWAKVMSVHYKEFGKNPQEWLAMRYAAKKAVGDGYDEIPYQKVMTELGKTLDSKNDPQEFIKTCLEMDVAVELGCQYPNRKMIKLLRKFKEKGKKIVLVSDFYLPEKAYKHFFKINGIEDLFDHVFISETYQASKRTGSLYKCVLGHLQANPEECIMIGDQKVDDVINAEKCGIKGIRYFPFWHKVFTNLSRIFNFDYSRKIVAIMGNRLRHHSLFGEYVFSLFLFEEQLARELNQDNLNEVTFFSRGGYLLKSFFDIYNHIYHHLEVKSSYCYISRKVVFSAYNTESEDYHLLSDYLKPFIHGGQLVFVDEGWYCHSQQKLSEIFHLPTKGFYLGVRGRDDIPENKICIRKGLLFDIGNHKTTVSKDYGIFCTNCSLYEQMLTAPEGSVVGYERKDGDIIPILDYNEIEQKAYQKHISDWQQQLELSFRGLCVWLTGQRINKRQVANLFLKADLYNSYERCSFLNEMDASMVDNCQNTKQNAKNIKDVHIPVLNLICHPDMYLNQICKVQRKIYKHPMLNAIYRLFAIVYECYVKILIRGNH
jgi:HAD superfamily hydrolase (TIGR01549 family)